ncbi:hypothetical protein C7B82_31095 [Stenomitos frigidus ULC18]|uniref:Uncharacterized protein n=1 Tax=Stenomitos frigidus ULC18 TaxID=2107698 RepID=A0A2T1DSH8_9CYAN|nr:hypothetical protein C7B82_31095 [Stenomitos frigidus ULC18]
MELSVGLSLTKPNSVNADVRKPGMAAVGLNSVKTQPPMHDSVQLQKELVSRVCKQQKSITTDWWGRFSFFLEGYFG